MAARGWVASKYIPLGLFALVLNFLRQVFMTCNFVTVTAVTYLIVMNFSIWPIGCNRYLVGDEAKFPLLIQFWEEKDRFRSPIPRSQLPNHSQALYKGTTPLRLSFPYPELFTACKKYAAVRWPMLVFTATRQTGLCRANKPKQNKTQLFPWCDARG